MTRARIIQDNDPIGNNPVQPGTIVEVKQFGDEYDGFLDGAAIYSHPVTGESWYSLPYDFEVLPDE